MGGIVDEVIVENKPGAARRLGVRAVKEAPPIVLSQSATLPRSSAEWGIRPALLISTSMRPVIPRAPALEDRGKDDPTRLSSGSPEADNAYRICAYSLSSVTAFDVLRQFLEGLVTEFDRAESDPRIALSLRRMQLP